MVHKGMGLMVLVSLLSLSAASALGGVLLMQDDFLGAAVDLDKWQLVEGPDASITQSGGMVVFNQPAAELCYLATSEQFDPVKTPLIITGSCTLAPEGEIHIWTRANVIADTDGGPADVLDSGVRISFTAEREPQAPELDIEEKTPSLWPMTVLADETRVIDENDVLDWRFEILDDGTTITATFIWSGDPNVSLTATATSTTVFKTNFLAFSVPNGSLDAVDISTSASPKIVWVSARHASSTDPNVPSDYGWVDLLESEGYDVNDAVGPVAGTSYWETLDPNKIALLNAADLVIISRDNNSGGVASDVNEVTAWNSVTSPMMLLSAHIARSNRWMWFDTTSVGDRQPYFDAMAVDANDPVFDDVQLDVNDVVQYMDPNVASGFASFILTGDAGNGEAVAIRPDTGTIEVARWRPGLPFYAATAQTPADTRVFFSAGTQEVSGSLTDWGVMNLTPAGQTMFLNAVKYLVFPKSPPGPEGLVHHYTFADGTAKDDVGDADGVLMGDAEVVDGSLLLDGGAWLELPGAEIAMDTYPGVTLSAWFTPVAGANPGFHMLAYFGATGTGAVSTLGYQYLFVAPARGDDVSRAAIQTRSLDDTPWDDETGVSDSVEQDDGLLHHYVVTVTSTDLTFYVDGELIGVAELAEGNRIGGISEMEAFLGMSGYSGDPLWTGSIQEFSIYNRALTEAEALDLFAAGPQ